METCRFCSDPSKCAVCEMLNKAPGRLTSASIAKLAQSFTLAPVRAPQANVASVVDDPAPTAPMPKPLALVPAPPPGGIPSAAHAAIADFAKKEAVKEMESRGAVAGNSIGVALTPGDWARLGQLEAAGIISTEEARRIGTSWIGNRVAVLS